MEAHKLRCQHIPGLTHLTIIPRHSSFYNPLLQAPACTSAMMAFIQRQQAWYKQPPQKVCFQVAAAAAIPTRFAARIVSAVLRQSRFGTFSYYPDGPVRTAAMFRVTSAARDVSRAAIQACSLHRTSIPTHRDDTPRQQTQSGPRRAAPTLPRNVFSSSKHSKAKYISMHPFPSY